LKIINKYSNFNKIKFSKFSHGVVYNSTADSQPEFRTFSKCSGLKSGETDFSNR
jgi:hypothetical protein